MGGGMAWVVSKRGRNRYERSRSEHSHSVTARANRARKPSQPGAFAYCRLPRQFLNRGRFKSIVACCRYQARFCSSVVVIGESVMSVHLIRN